MPCHRPPRRPTSRQNIRSEFAVWDKSSRSYELLAIILVALCIHFTCIDVNIHERKEGRNSATRRKGVYVCLVFKRSFPEAPSIRHQPRAFGPEIRISGL